VAEFDLNLVEQTPFDILGDYERRSLAHVAGMPEQLEAPGLWRGIGFRLGDAILVSDIGEINEILILPAMTHVPGTKAWLLGIANVRGNLIPIVHLRGLLEGEAFRHSDATRVLVIKQTGGSVGLIIDEVLGQKSFLEENQRETAHFLDSPIGSFVSSEIPQGQIIWGVFSMATLLKMPEFLQAAA
jgi:twitching motility protein PilI